LERAALPWPACFLLRRDSALSSLRYTGHPPFVRNSLNENQNQKSVLALAVASFASQATDTDQPGVLAVAVASFASHSTTGTLTAERDAARTEVITLSAQLATLTSQVSTLTAERDAARSELTAFTAKADSDAIQAAIDAANIAGRAYPFEREMLTTYGATQGLAKLQSYLTARPAVVPGAPATETPAD